MPGVAGHSLRRYLGAIVRFPLVVLTRIDAPPVPRRNEDGSSRG
jgi:hypothetical protein